MGLAEKLHMGWGSSQSWGILSPGRLVLLSPEAGAAGRAVGGTEGRHLGLPPCHHHLPVHRTWKGRLPPPQARSDSWAEF